ncbi:thiopurine S-methyltransferase [Bosea sp. 117]|uniref:thiopurine S-methyltransferase n=1 Tax=Bosea sp. 117 TaxID=1125973 RepID=UPI00068D7C51|nr:thiopurine S-methyltransferase [Bosea sp. 117]
MDAEFWHGKWRRGEIAFHQPEPNPLLTRNLPALGLPAGARLFLPLCGKSLDIGWLLAQGYRVAGAELSRMAIEQLFAELSVEPQITQDGPLLRFEAGNLVIFVGDIFDLDGARLGVVDAVYDRAALVALPQDMRTRYAAHLLALTRGAPQLLVTFEYDQAHQEGPPFAVGEADVRRHYGATHELARLEWQELAGGLKGLCPAAEVVWRLIPRRQRLEQSPAPAPARDQIA